MAKAKVKTKGSSGLIKFLTMILRIFGTKQTTIAEKVIKKQIKVLEKDKKKRIKETTAKFVAEAEKQKESIIQLLDTIEEKASSSVVKASAVIEKDFAEAVSKVTEDVFTTETVKRVALKVALTALLKEM